MCVCICIYTYIYVRFEIQGLDFRVQGLPEKPSYPKLCPKQHEIDERQNDVLQAC